MRLFYILIFLLCSKTLLGQNGNSLSYSADSLLFVTAEPTLGFHHNYLLFIPKGTLKNTATYLLVEPNNTGVVSDSIQVHHQAAVHLASKSSIGNNVSTELKIPLLVPVFPRPKSQPLMYTHALDRDIILEDNDNALKRIDLQLIAMIEHAQETLRNNNIIVNDKILMNGFSASATFTNRFLFIHPDKVKAAAMGGLNGVLMLPNKEYKHRTFNYPLGTNDFEHIFNKTFDFKTYKTIPQFIYMGSKDNNDAVQYDDAYDTKEQVTVKSVLGEIVQDRWLNCQGIYNAQHITAKFKTYQDIGHWTTGAINLEVIQFFFKHLK